MLRKTLAILNKILEANKMVLIRNSKLRMTGGSKVKVRVLNILSDFHEVMILAHDSFVVHSCTCSIVSAIYKFNMS